MKRLFRFELLVGVLDKVREGGARNIQVGALTDEPEEAP